MALILLGVALNLTALAANGNRMPVASITQAQLSRTGRHVIAGEQHRLLWLSDRFAFGRLRASLGDLVQWMGLVLYVWAVFD